LLLLQRQWNARDPRQSSGGVLLGHCCSQHASTLRPIRTGVWDAVLWVDKAWTGDARLQPDHQGAALLQQRVLWWHMQQLPWRCIHRCLLLLLLLLLLLSISGLLQSRLRLWGGRCVQPLLVCLYLCGQQLLLLLLLLSEELRMLGIQLLLLLWRWHKL
jgi:hypothetical protein